MIETLLGGLLGGAFRLAPEVLKWMDRNGERSHELAMQDKALEFEKLRGAQRMGEIGAAADAAWNTGANVLAQDVSKVKVLGGIGSIHTPTLHALMEHKRMLILEAESDWRFLQLIAKQAGVTWPKNIIPWYWTGSAGERQQLYLQLLTEIQGLKAVSIRDRDDEPDGTVGADLLDKSFLSKQPGFIAMKWRRRHIENHLLCTGAIARAAKCSEQAVADFFTKHALVIPQDPTPTDVAPAIRDAHGKEIFISGDSVRKNFGITRDDVAKHLAQNEVPADMITFFAALTDLAK